MISLLCLAAAIKVINLYFLISFTSLCFIRFFSLSYKHSFGSSASWKKHSWNGRNHQRVFHNRWTIIDGQILKAR